MEMKIKSSINSYVVLVMLVIQTVRIAMTNVSSAMIVNGIVNIVMVAKAKTAKNVRNVKDVMIM